MRRTVKTRHPAAARSHAHQRGARMAGVGIAVGKRGVKLAQARAVGRVSAGRANAARRARGR
jgi:hypothetical protein